MNDGRGRCALTVCIRPKEPPSVWSHEGQLSVDDDMMRVAVNARRFLPRDNNRTLTGDESREAICAIDGLGRTAPMELDNTSIISELERRVHDDQIEIATSCSR